MNRDQRGITFIELVIAIAIASIIMVAATMFLGAAHKNYNNASAQIDLQSESQILMEQIGMWVMEGNRVEALDPSTSGLQIDLPPVHRELSSIGFHARLRWRTRTESQHPNRPVSV